MMPVHWGTFPLLTGTPEQLEASLQDSGINTAVVGLRPGERY